MVVINHKLPANAVEVTVEKITNPNKILIRDVTHAEKLKLITEKLKVVAKKYKMSAENVNDRPIAVGTLTIIDRNTPDGINLPAWYSRAIITGFNRDTLKYSAFLVDYGVTFKLCRQAFIVIAQDDIPDQYLTESVSLYKIIPAIIKSSNDDRVDLLAKKTWCPEAIDLAKQLISASRKCYFELSATGRTGKKYGELYLIIENQIILLRKALVKAHTAIFVNDDLLDVKSSDNSFSSAKSISSPALDSGNNTDSNTTSASVNSVAQRVGFEEVLVSSNEPCHRLADIASAKFTKNIHHALNKLSVRRLRNIQSYMWPAINKGLDVMAVAPTKSGKTFGYVAPIANMIITTRQYQEDGQPMALILCPSSKEVLYIKEHFRLILSDFNDIKIIGAFNGCEYRSITAQIYNGCHIFIATPAFLFRYLEDKDSGAPVKFSSINHLVIDHLDDLLLKHVDTLIPLLKKYTPFGKKKAQSSRLMALQTIGVARQWSSLLGTFTKNALKNPFYCIGSFADATIFCGIQLRTRSILKAQKLAKTEELLEKNYLLVKTMIVCAEGDEAHELNNYLSSKNIRTLYVPEDIVRAEIVDAKGQWDRGIAGNYEVLICTDRALPILEVTDVDWLIHYSIAVPTKSTFLFRFSTLMTNLRKKSPTTEVTIFIDETNDVQLRSILNLVERSGYKLSAEQKNAFERVYVNLERQKKNYPICDNIKAFGNCEKGNACTFRHCFIAEVDTPMTPVTVGDKVKMTITYVHDATHFSAKIQEYTDSQGNKHMVSAAAHVEIESKVYQYFAAMRNRRKCHSVEVGGIYGYDERLDEYCRVQIINVVKKNDDDKPLVVDLRNIDSGYIYAHQNVSRLREMPKELAEAPAHIVEVFLSNISPYDKEIEWNVRANKCTMSWFTEQLEAPCTSLRGTVVLHFGNTLWVDPLEVRMQISIANKELHKSSLKDHLIKKKYGVANDNHIKLLKKMCSYADMMELE